jgi:predicted helicase
MVHACGAGKTRTTAMIAQDLRVARVLVLLPSIALVAQTMTEWGHQFGGALQFRSVCSQTGVAPSDPVFAGQGQVARTARDIADFLAAPTFGSARVRAVFATYQSSAKVAAAMALLDSEHADTDGFDLVVCDEAHRLVGPWGRRYSTVLSASAIPARRHLFATATPKLTVAGAKSGARVVAMDDEAVFGSVAHRYTFRDAIRDGHLTDYRLSLLAVQEKDLPRALRDGSERDLRAAYAKVATLKAMHTYGLRRVVSYHATVERAFDFCTDIAGLNAGARGNWRVPGLVTGLVHGGMPDWERAAGMALLSPAQPHPALLANPRCLTEGIDVPSLDGVVLVDPRDSVVDMVQTVGRVLRSSPGKTVGHIIVPVLLRGKQSVEDATSSAGFSTAFKVLAALRDHDEDMAAYIDTAAAGSALDLPPMPSGVRFDIPTNLDPSVARRLSNAARLSMIEATAATPMAFPRTMDCPCGCGRVEDVLAA